MADQLKNDGPQLPTMQECCYRCEEEARQQLLNLAEEEYSRDWEEYHRELWRVIKEEPEDKEWQTLHREQQGIDMFRLAFNEWLLVTWKSRRDRNRYWEGAFD